MDSKNQNVNSKQRKQQRLNSEITNLIGMYQAIKTETSESQDTTSLDVFDLNSDPSRQQIVKTESPMQPEFKSEHINNQKELLSIENSSLKSHDDQENNNIITSNNNNNNNDNNNHNDVKIFPSFSLSMPESSQSTTTTITTIPNDDNNNNNNNNNNKNNYNNNDNTINNNISISTDFSEPMAPVSPTPLLPSLEPTTSVTSGPPPVRDQVDSNSGPLFSQQLFTHSEFPTQEDFGNRHIGSKRQQPPLQPLNRKRRRRYKDEIREHMKNFLLRKAKEEGTMKAAYLYLNYIAKMPTARPIKYFESLVLELKKRKKYPDRTFPRNTKSIPDSLSSSESEGESEPELEPTRNTIPRDKPSIAIDNDGDDHIDGIDFISSSPTTKSPKKKRKLKKKNRIRKTQHHEDIVSSEDEDIYDDDIGTSSRSIVSNRSRFSGYKSPSDRTLDKKSTLTSSSRPASSSTSTELFVNSTPSIIITPSDDNEDNEGMTFNNNEINFDDFDDDDEENNNDYVDNQQQISAQVSRPFSKARKSIGGRRQISYDDYIPENVKQHLKLHQKEGIDFLWKAIKNNRGALLSHSMGLGKSLQAIVVIDRFMKQSKKGKVMILGPRGILPMWEQEFERWTDPGSKNYNIENLGRIPSNAYESRYREFLKKGGVLLMTYHTYAKGCGAKRSRKRGVSNTRQTALEKKVFTSPDIVLVDEGHRIKDPKTQIAQPLLHHTKTRKRIVLTGCPLQNNLSEYFTLLQFLGQTFKYKEELFIEPIQDGLNPNATRQKKEFAQRRSHVLTQRLKQFVHRVGQEVLLNVLEPKYEFTLILRLTRFQKQLIKKANSIKGHERIQRKCQIADHPAIIKRAYDKLKQGNYDDQGGTESQSGTESETSDIESMNPQETTFQKKEQYLWAGSIIEEDASALYQYGFSSKFVITLSIINQCIRLNEKVIIFSQWRNCLDIMEQVLQGTRIPNSIEHWRPSRDYVRIDGKVRTNDRYERAQQFNDSRSGVKVLLGTTLTAGVGLNLSSGTRVILIGCDYNPCKDLEAIFRTYRYGQDKPVYVYRLLTDTDAERDVYHSALLKRALSRQIVDQEYASTIEMMHSNNDDDDDDNYDNSDDDIDGEEILDDSDEERERKEVVGWNGETHPDERTSQCLEEDSVLNDVFETPEVRPFIKTITEEDSLFRFDNVLSEEQKKIAQEEYRKDEEKISRKQR